MSKVRLPDKGTTRRIISDFFIEHRSLIMPHVLEVGSARPANAWWADLRSHLGMEDDEWTGVDMQDSDCTDIIADLTGRLAEFPLSSIPNGGYGSCVCAETLEHVTYPSAFLQNTWSLLRPGAWIVITSPFAFPVHSFPNDYWRFTPEGLKLLLRDAGFEQAQAEELNRQEIKYYDHDGDSKYRCLPMWVGAIARKPE